jgi:mono/diheme cytochrome c family protein
MIGLAALALAGIGRPSEPPPEPRPPEPDDAILSGDRGEALFMARCAECHSGAIAPSAAELGRHDAATFDRMVQDHPEVFAFEGLTTQDIADIYTWLRTQARPE